MSEWTCEVLSPHVEKLVVLGIPPGKRGPKSDVRDAFGLANQLQLGNTELAVYKGHGAFRQLREQSRVYTKITDDVVRVKNRLKAMYRSRGIATTGRSVFGERGREAWLKILPVSMRSSAEQLYTILDAVESVKATSQKQLVAESHRHPISRKLETIPGMGQVRVAQALAILVTPHRFRTKRHLRSYAGRGIVMRSSSDWVRQKDGWVRSDVLSTRGPNPRCNRHL